MSYTVRLAREEDVPAVIGLLKQVNRVHHEGRPDLFKAETKYAPEELPAIFADEDTPVFVCTDEEGKVLGHGFCVLQRPENSRLLTDILTLYIDDICVDETARGRHVGKAIYEHILAYARRKKCYNVTLNVWHCNPGAMKFYESLGLVPYKLGMETILNYTEKD